MKSCPTCNRTYPDDTLAFCLMDGSVLSAPYDPAKVRRVPATTDPPPTEVMNAPTAAPPPRPPLQSTLQAPTPEVRQFFRMNQTAPSSGIKPVDLLLRSTFLIRGFVGIAAAAVTALWWTPPAHSWETSGSLDTMVYAFVVFALVGAALAIVAGVRVLSLYKTGGALILDGTISILSGAFVVLEVQNLTFSSDVLSLRESNVFMVIYACGFVSSAMQIGAARQLRKHVTRTSLLAWAGGASLVASAVLFFNDNNSSKPFLYFKSLIFFFACYEALTGALWAGFGVSMRNKLNE